MVEKTQYQLENNSAYVQNNQENTLYYRIETQGEIGFTPVLLLGNHDEIANICTSIC
jgi:hypothetical protein